MSLNVNRGDLLGQAKEERFSPIDVVLIVVMIILIINIVVQAVWLSPVKVDGSSMNKTLTHNDWLYMDKLKTPERGDVVVFKVSKDVNYVKRIIGLPGDSVKTVDGQVYVKRGKNADWEKLNEPYAYYMNGRPKGTYLPWDITNLQDVPEVNLKEGEMFVLGDNRWGSKDSREIGVVKTSSILGIVPNWAIENKAFYGKYLDFIEDLNLFFKGCANKFIKQS